MTFWLIWETTPHTTISFFMVLSTQCDHSFRIVMWLDANWGIKMMILKIGITASFYRTSEANFSAKCFFLHF